MTRVVVSTCLYSLILLNYTFESAELFNGRLLVAVLLYMMSRTPLDLPELSKMIKMQRLLHGFLKTYICGYLDNIFKRHMLL